MPEEPNTSTIDLSSLVKKTIAIVAIGFFIFLLVWLGSFAAFQAWNAGRILPHVMVGTLDMGGLAPEEAGVKLYTQFNLTQNHKTVLMLPDGLHEVDLSALGIRLDAAATAMHAYQHGRELLDGQWIAQMFNLYPEGFQLNPDIIFDQQTAYDYLLQLSQQVDQPVVEASLHMEGTRVIASPGRIGFVVDIPATIDLVSQHIHEGDLDEITLVVEKVEPDLMDASPFTSIAEKALSRSFFLRIPDSQPDAGRAWEISPEEMAPMLTFPKVTENGSTSIQLRLHENTLIYLLAKISAESAIAAENSRFIFNDDTRQLDLLSNSIIGRQLNMEESAHAVQEAVSAGYPESVLVFDLIRPEVADTATASDLGITELVHEESSYFFGSSSARIHNIETAAREFHGLLVAPGETFSMASAMGDVSLDAGYTEALIIFAGRTIEGVGGGVCQVSTTLFRTAFFAGFPVAERHPHAYRVSYYEKTSGNRRDPNLAGLDATVYVPIVDLKFTNDTPYWLLMETYINPSASRITWKFYSTSDNRSVQWRTTGPINIVGPKKPIYTLNPKLEPGEIKQVDWEAEGADVRVNRSVYRDDSLYFEDSFFTHYAPWRAVFEYGHGVDGIPTMNDED